MTSQNQNLKMLQQLSGALKIIQKDRRAGKTTQSQLNKLMGVPNPPKRSRVKKVDEQTVEKLWEKYNLLEDIADDLLKKTNDPFRKEFYGKLSNAMITVIGGLITDTSYDHYDKLFNFIYQILPNEAQELYDNRTSGMRSRTKQIIYPDALMASPELIGDIYNNNMASVAKPSKIGYVSVKGKPRNVSSKKMITYDPVQKRGYDLVFNDLENRENQKKYYDMEFGEKKPDIINSYVNFPPLPAREKEVTLNDNNIGALGQLMLADMIDNAPTNKVSHRAKFYGKKNQNYPTKYKKTIDMNPNNLGALGQILMTNMVARAPKVKPSARAQRKATKKNY
jgi:hypothetical protein